MDIFEFQTVFTSSHTKSTPQQWAKIHNVETAFKDLASTIIENIPAEHLEFVARKLKEVQNACDDTIIGNVKTQNQEEIPVSKSEKKRHAARKKKQ